MSSRESRAVDRDSAHKRSQSKQRDPPSMSAAAPLRIVLLGNPGAGKSSCGNTILRQKEFTSHSITSSVTHECSMAQATVSGRSVSVVDTPAFFDTHMSTEQSMMEISRSVCVSSPGPHAFLIVFPVNMRFTEQEQQIPQMIELLFGEEVLKYSIILFTHGDLLGKVSVENLIEENSGLRSLVQQCGGRYHVFNNRDEENREQVEDLLQKIDSMIQQNGGAHYTNQMLEDALRFRQEEEKKRRQRKKEERMREEEQREEEQREEERKLQKMKQRQEEMERVTKERRERVRAEYEEKKKQEETQRQTCVCS